MSLTAYTGEKPKLSLVEIINMSVGFFGIQFGWDLQRANMSDIYKSLNADSDKLPYLFLAAPLTGLFVQPIIGYFSDRTWHPRWGRRRPYFFIGALLSSIALIFMPYSSELWMAAGLLWVLDVFGNVAMEPFRAFVTDKLPDSQINRGFVMQSLMIGLGGSIASALPYIFSSFGIDNIAAKGEIADNVKYSFYTGAFFFFAAVLYTVITSKEYPPSVRQESVTTKEKKNFFSEIIYALKNMPARMRIIALVQFFTWPGLFLMWFYYVLAAAEQLSGSNGEGTAVYAENKDFAKLTLSFFSIVTFFFSLALPKIADRLGRRITHSICLLAGAMGLITVAFVTDKYQLIACMAGVGIAWASILSMPYAMLSGVLPKDKVGLYVGIFNFFIVLPEIIAALFYPTLMENVFNSNMMSAVVSGGVLMLIAAVICYFFIKEKRKIDETAATKLEIEEQRPI